ncbi:hypothetical protein [Streptomyces murinus]
MLKSIRAKRAATIVGATLSASILCMSQAFAWSGDWNGPGGGGAGDISFSSNTTASWDFTVIDTKSDGYCTRMKIIVDRPYWTDVPLYQTNYACGYQKATHWKDSYSTTGGTKMRSLKLQQCRIHSNGDDETCSQVAQVSNPKY